MLPPDNFQEEPTPVVAHRTSPTNIGLYLSSVIAANDFGWQSVPRIYAVALLVTAAVFWLLSAPDPGVGKNKPQSLMQQLMVLRDVRVWKYCQYYSVVFGGFHRFVDLDAAVF